VETSSLSALDKNKSIDIGLYSPFVFCMGSSLAVFQHFRNVEDVIAVFKMCIMLRVAWRQGLVKILDFILNMDCRTSHLLYGNVLKYGL